jgi:hypothetical protein
MYLWNDPAIDRLSGLQAVANIGREGAYGIYGAKMSSTQMGTATLSAYAPGYTFKSNVFERGDPSNIVKYSTPTVVLPAGALTGGALDDRLRPVAPEILAVTDDFGVTAGANVDAILALFAQYGVSWS